MRLRFREDGCKQNAPVPIQGQMRENTSAVPPCLTENPPTSFRRRHARSPITPALRRTILTVQSSAPLSMRPRRSICRFAAIGLSAIPLREVPYSLCVRRRFDLRLNGFIQCSTEAFPMSIQAMFFPCFPSQKKKTGIPADPGKRFTYSAASSAAGAIRASS